MIIMKIIILPFASRILTNLGHTGILMDHWKLEKYASEFD